MFLFSRVVLGVIIVLNFTALHQIHTTSSFPMEIRPNDDILDKQGRVNIIKAKKKHIFYTGGEGFRFRRNQH
jgi:hypothetical protein